MKIGKYIIIGIIGLYTLGFGEDFTKTFLRAPLDAVSRSIGGFNQAYSIGAIDLFTNPALLSQHTKSELQFSNIINLLSTQYASFAFSVPVGRMENIGIGLVARLNPAVPENEVAGIKLRNYEHYQYAVVVGYSRSFYPLSVGVNLKYFRMRYDGGEFYKTGSAFSVDLGMYYAMNRSFRFGFIFQAPFQINWDTDYREVSPGRMGMGVVWSPNYISENFMRLLFSMDRFSNEPLQMNFGIILTPLENNLGLKNFSVRAGLGNFDSDMQQPRSVLDWATDSAPVFTIGTGIGFDAGSKWRLKLDYCLQIIEYVSNQHIITTRISF